MKTKDGKKKTEKKGLLLKKETLRQLTKDDLQNVVGGVVPTCPMCPTK